MLEYYIGLILLTFAVYQDIKRREIDDIISIVLIIFGLLFAFYKFLIFGNLYYIIISIIGGIICFILGYIMFLFGVGGADGKILTGLGILVPKYHTPIYTPIGILLSYKYIPTFPLLVLINSLFLCVLLPFYIFIKNIINGVRPKSLKEFFYMFIAERKKFKDIGEFCIIYGKDRINIFRSYEDNKKEKYNDNDLVWISPEIPFILPMFLSYIITPIIGDYILYLILKPFLG